MAEGIAVLESQRAAHPELGEMADDIIKCSTQKLYHQLTQTLLKYLAAPPFAPSASGSGKELLEVFNGFIKDFEAKLDKVCWVRILATVCKPQNPSDALELIAPYEANVSGHRDAKYLWQALKAEKFTDAGQYDEAKDLLDGLQKEIDVAYEVDAIIQSQLHKTQAQLWKALKQPNAFYKSSILFLSYTPLKDIPEADRAKLAFDIGVACLVAADEFDFAELLQQELMPSLDGTELAWIKDLLQAFGEGKFDMYDAALAKHRAQIDATPELKAAEASMLRSKMAALALMELAFRKPKKQRRLTFAEVAEHCRLDPSQVEHLVMKAMCEKLIQGKIDEVSAVVIITWVKPRILDTSRIDLMRERMDGWATQTSLLLDHLEEMTPELLVS